MSKHWYNDWGTLFTDLGQIVTLQNPNNKPPPVNIPLGPTRSSLPISTTPPKTGQTVLTQNPDPHGPDYWDGSSDPNGGGDESLISKIGGFLKDHVGDIASGIEEFAKKYGTTALEAWNIYQAAQRQTQADNYASEALKTSQDAYKANAPLRDAGRAGMLNPNANVPDIAALRTLATTGSGNPFAKALPMAPPAPAKPFVPPVPVGNAPSGVQNTGSPLPVDTTQPGGRLVGPAVLSNTGTPLPIDTTKPGGALFPGAIKKNVLPVVQ